MIVKNLLRKLLIFFRLDITKNLQYDRLTRVIMKQNIKKDAHCIDIGCHKGEILDLMLQYAPHGKHFAFEPIPCLFENLKKKYKDSVQIFPYALSDTSGFSTFQFVTNAPAYSGLKRRKYDISNPNIEEIEVEVKTLDEIIPFSQKIDFIKIDVEGGEFGVLKGATHLLKQNRPVIIFECGKGACEHYGIHPLHVFDFITCEVGLQIFTLKSYVQNKTPLSRALFEEYFNLNLEYYFVAAKY